MADTGLYTAAELARRAGLPLRTVRYYIQKGLIAPPNGRGRGAHFGDEHLAQLERVRLLQGAGFDLEAIRESGMDLVAVLQNLHTDGLQILETFEPATRERLRARLAGRGRKAPADTAELAAARRGEDRIAMAEGVDLVVRADVPLPSPKELVEIALLIRKIFSEPD